MSWIIALTVAAAPAYVIRFSLFQKPTNVLMVWIFGLWTTAAAYIFFKKRWPAVKYFLSSLHRPLTIAVLLFFLSGLAGLFVGGIDEKKIGQFIVLFFEPISLFFLFGFWNTEFSNVSSRLRLTLYVLLGMVGSFCIIQYFTLFGLPVPWWGNGIEPKRATGFFTHPNFLALFVTPLLAFLIPDLKAKSITHKQNLLWWALWVIGSLGLLLSLSRAGWLGLAAAVALFFFFAADKKTKKILGTLAITAVLIVAFVPNLRWRVMLPFYGEKSAASRLLLWKAGIAEIKQSPVLGLGLNGFAKQYADTAPGLGLDNHNFPHNIVLDLWVETGLLGTFSFLFVCGWLLVTGLRKKQDFTKLSVSLFIVALLCQGLIDNPYFKNDLATVFWIIASLSLL